MVTLLVPQFTLPGLYFIFIRSEIQRTEMSGFELCQVAPIELLELCACCAKSNVNLHANFVLHLMSPHGLYVHTRPDCKYSALPCVQLTCYKMGWILSSTHLVTLFTNHLYRYLLTKSVIIFCDPLIKIQHSFWLRPDKN
jgi:hypothetical protein